MNYLCIFHEDRLTLLKLSQRIIWPLLPTLAVTRKPRLTDLKAALIGPLQLYEKYDWSIVKPILIVTAGERAYPSD